MMITRTMFLFQLLVGLLFVLPGAGFEPASVQAEGCTAPDWDLKEVYLRGEIVTRVGGQTSQ